MPNYNCDGSGPHTPGTVRTLPFPGGNLFLCAACFRHEMNWRQQRNRELAPEARYEIPEWGSLQTYAEARADA